tara:strand:- start:143 stop:334 length:192 start_codon:yes stop_codon:yes gene_type:complete
VPWSEAAPQEEGEACVAAEVGISPDGPDDLASNQLRGDRSQVGHRGVYGLPGEAYLHAGHRHR